MKHYLPILFFMMGSIAFGQELSGNYRTKKVAVADTVSIDSVSINPARFLIKTTNQTLVDTSKYKVNFERAEIYFSPEIVQASDSLVVEYLKYPAFLTKKYSLLDPGIILKDRSNMDRLYTIQEPTRESDFLPFEGLNSSGSISRGITIGNNQNAVVNSQLDLQITGKLSEKVSIRASIQDANIPVQEGGYSQGLEEFDQIFIELFSDDWRIRAGDIDLENRNSYFGSFQKKIQGISLGGRLRSETSETNLYAAGALVRGVFSSSSFQGREGNQGPYKLVGPNGELYILIVSGSERVFVNGILLERGDTRDYIIDYNAGEIKFNPNFPITSDMRIKVEYQYTDRNYTRFIGYGGGNHTSEKLDIGAYAYIESDSKNQPLQQNLTEEQVEILKQAGDDPSEMIAPSAVPDSYSENKIQYRKEFVNGEEIFVFSNNPEDKLFNVRFSLVGPNQGNYIITNNNAISRIFEYVPPVNGIPQGNFEPVIRLTAPEMIQVGGVNGKYRPTLKTEIGFEVAASKEDLNLFSDLDNGDNSGFAIHLNGKQKIYTGDDIQLDGIFNFDFIDKTFRTVERVYAIEFDRDWNLGEQKGNQSFFTGGLQMQLKEKGTAIYQFQKLDFSENFSGSRHLLSGALRFDSLRISANSSYLTARGSTFDSDFLRLNSRAVYSLPSSWIGAWIASEDNRQKVKVTDSLTPLSQKFVAYEVFYGIGDSTSVFVETGFRQRFNDSLRSGFLERVSRSNTYYLKSQLIKNERSQLSVYANFRKLKDEYGEREDEQSLNSRLLYNQNFLNGGIQWNTTFETSSGVLPQQEFTFVEVEPGRGTHTWVDYNNNNIQELQEFEIAQFPDEAKYIRILLPNQFFVKIHQNKFGQILTLNPQFFTENEDVKNLLGRFYNQTSYLIDRKSRRDENNFDINPFSGDREDQLGLNLNFRNVLFYNRGKQRFTTSYTYTVSRAETLLSVGLQKNKLLSHQLNFTHKMVAVWLANLKAHYGENSAFSENYEGRNFIIESYDIAPKISYLFSENAEFSAFYQLANKENLLGDRESLVQQKLGVSFTYNKAQSLSLNGEFNYISNDFKGSAFSPVAFQMLEGLQPDRNFTWTLLLQRSITKYLDANLSYLGRKSENSGTIHTGSIQLKAYF